VLSFDQSNDARRTMGVPANSNVIPRWEWRTLERTFAAPPLLTGEPAGDGVTVHEETYLLSLLAPHNVKVREGRLEVKRLERVGSAGLELWRPVVHATFPIDGATVAKACDAWGVEPPAGDVRSYSLAELLREVVVPHHDLRIVSLVKRRIPITVAGCLGERAQITLGKHRWHTVSFEDADPARVRAALRELGLDSTRNENYPRALKRILSLPDHSSVPSTDVVH
jgi:exopolyphosphatase / guanosine-5'-triphosphate,3'-diphosphate pyrophosphatase